MCGVSQLNCGSMFSFVELHTITMHRKINGVLGYDKFRTLQTSGFLYLLCFLSNPNGTGHYNSCLLLLYFHSYLMIHPQKADTVDCQICTGEPGSPAAPTTFRRKRTASMAY